MTATEVGTRRFDVRSADGTPLAVWADGEGPPLVLVHGSMCDHTAFDPLVAELRGAMGGAALTGDVHRLVLYEPGLGIPYPAGSTEEVQAALAAGDMETAVRLVLVGIVGVTEAEMAALRSGPRWPTMLASVPTVPRECRAEDGWRYRPGAFDGIAAPTLLLAGSESPPVLRQATDLAVAAIPGARVRMLQGHAHLAIRTDPAMVAAAIRQFVLG
jgi:pimeloyl-ACP methyl ester carboxylesterase